MIKKRVVPELGNMIIISCLMAFKRLYLYSTPKSGKNNGPEFCPFINKQTRSAIFGQGLTL